MPFLFSRQTSRVGASPDSVDTADRDVESGPEAKGTPSLLQISPIVPTFAAYENPALKGQSDHEVDNGVPRIEITLADEKDEGKSEKKEGKSLSLVVPQPQQLLPDSAPPTPTGLGDNEPLPRLEHYKDMLSSNKSHFSRPTLDELHNPPPSRKVSKAKRPSIFSLRSFKHDNDATTAEPIKFGWIRGVFIRCILNIWGVMLFLRMGWMTGQAGIGYSVAIILLSSLVTTLTTLSMSAICTNGEVKGGGAYYMISRSLGPEFGGAIGIIFALANCIAVAMYIVGAAEAVRDLLRVFDVGIVEFPSGINDIRIAGVCFLLLTAAITVVGMEWEAKAQIVLLILLLTAMADYFVGACLPPTLEQTAKGFVGWDINLAFENWVPDFRGETFFTVFAVFFPSVTGILAGANISGDLKDPSSAIPKGTLSAIFTTTITYVIIVVWLGSTTVRDATGNIADVMDGSFRNCTGKPSCDYGMLNYNQIMEMTSAFGPLIYAGIFAATLSSALAALVSAPRIFQALCKDKIFPVLNIFAKGSGVNDDPRRASIMVFVIALLFTVIGELNAIAPIISNFFMSAYSLVNFSCFHASYVKSPGFRPGFRYYNKWLSLVGAILCVVVMFVMNWITALVTYGIIIALYIYLNKKKPPVNWGSSTQGYIYKSALTAVVKLNRVEDHVKNYRPAILVLTGNTSTRSPLVDLTYNITRNQGLMVCGHVINAGPLPKSIRSAIVNHNIQFLEERKVKAFYNLNESDSFSDGVYALLQLTGLGKLRPNILLMGYKTSWQTCDEHDLQEYFTVIHHALDMHIALAILRLPEGLGYEAFYETDLGIPYGESPDLPKASEAIFPNDAEITSFPTINFTPSAEDKGHLKLPATIAKFRRLTSIEVAKQHCQIPAEVTATMNMFQKKQKKGTIDVWWLYDDGGLTILIPYLLSARPQWKACRLRVFIVAKKDNDLEQLQQNMTALFKKFRIDISNVTVLSDINVNPQEESKKQFNNLVSRWKSENRTESAKSQLNISQSDWSTNKGKTNRYIRLRELLVQHSKQATLVVMTLPMPRKGACPAPLYMAWLEILSNDMPPFLLIRGNQTSVLTFYS